MNKNVQKMAAVLRKSLPFISSTEIIKRQISKDAISVLDFGCGRGTSLSIELAKNKEIYLIGVDLFLPSLYAAKGIYDEVVLADIRFLPFQSASCDVAVASQVIEHLDKNLALVNSLELISRKTVIITVPVGPNPKHDLEDSNPYQAHRSEWYPDDFKKLGFCVWGCEGARFLRNEASHFKFNQAFYPIILALSLFTQLITFKLALASYQIVCVKQFKHSDLAM